MILNKDTFKNKDFEAWKVSVYRKEPALPGSLLGSKGTLKFSVAELFQLINGKGKPCRGVKTKLQLLQFFFWLWGEL